MNQGEIDWKGGGGAMDVLNAGVYACANPAISNIDQKGRFESEKSVRFLCEFVYFVSMIVADQRALLWELSFIWTPLALVS